MQLLVPGYPNNGRIVDGDDEYGIPKYLRMEKRIPVISFE